MQEDYLDDMIQKERSKAKVKSLLRNPAQGAALGLVAGMTAGGVNENLKLVGSSFKSKLGFGKLAAIGTATGFSLGAIKALFDKTDSDDAEVLIMRSYNRLREILKRKPTEEEFLTYYNKRVREVDQADLNKRYKSVNNAINAGTSIGLSSIGVAGYLRKNYNSMRESGNQKGGNIMRTSPTQRDFMANSSFESSLRESPQISQDHLFGWWEGNRMAESESNRIFESNYNFINRFAEADFIDGISSENISSAFEDMVFSAKEAIASGKKGWEERVEKVRKAFEKIKSKSKAAPEEPNPWEKNWANAGDSDELKEFRAKRNFAEKNAASAAKSSSMLRDQQAADAIKKSRAAFDSSKSDGSAPWEKNWANAGDSDELKAFRAGRSGSGSGSGAVDPSKVKKMRDQLNSLLEFAAKNKKAIGIGAGALTLAGAAGYALGNRKSESVIKSISNSIKQAVVPAPSYDKLSREIYAYTNDPEARNSQRKKSMALASAIGAAIGASIPPAGKLSRTIVGGATGLGVGSLFDGSMTPAQVNEFLLDRAEDFHNRYNRWPSESELRGMVLDKFNFTEANGQHPFRRGNSLSDYCRNLVQ